MELKDFFPSEEIRKIIYRKRRVGGRMAKVLLIDGRTIVFHTDGQYDWELHKIEPIKYRKGFIPEWIISLCNRVNVDIDKIVHVTEEKERLIVLMKVGCKPRRYLIDY